MLLALLIAITAWILSLFMPWWSLAIPCVLFGAWKGEKGSSSFLYGFIGIGALWLIQVLIIDMQNQQVLSSRIADLFSLPHSSLVILITVIIGGLAGGFSTLTGYFAKEFFSN
ncbi:MAG: hypothetical protein U5J95_08025 [Balneolaceae bacterium]|nr:hypothetical protein [Balneolaceae bacterium]